MEIFIGDKLIDIMCAKILLRKLNNKEHLKKEDFKIIEIILKNLIKRG